MSQGWLFGHVTRLFRVLGELRVRLWFSGSRGRGQGRLFAFHEVIGSGVAAGPWHSFGRGVIVIDVVVRGVDEAVGAGKRYRRKETEGN